jgi:nucleotide-binding universal stress UspA family protein
MAAPVIKHILLTTDLSAEAMKAYPYASSLSTTYGASLHILTCIDTSIQLGVGGSMEMPIMYVPETIAAIKERTTKDLADHVKEHFPGSAPTLHIREAAVPVHHTIIDFIQQSNVDLVIMGSHGRSGLARTFIGSVAEQVLRGSSKPVLVVPAKGA